MRRRSLIGLVVCLGAIGFIIGWQTTPRAGVSFQGVSFQGVSFQGVSFQGVSFQGASPQGVSFQGPSTQGVSFQGVSFQGVSFQGVSFQGPNLQGVSFQGVSFQGVSFQGVSFQGVSFQGASPQGVSFQGTGVDRARSLAGPIQIGGISRANFTSSNTSYDGLQSGDPLIYTQVPDATANAILQAGPSDTGAGSYISVPGLPATTTALKGSFWNMVLADACTTSAQCAAGTTCSNGGCIKACDFDQDCSQGAQGSPGATCQQGACSNLGGGVPLYISDVEVDHQQNSSNYPSNDDIFLYTVYFRQPQTGQWASLCPLDAGTGKPTAMAVPLNPFDHSNDGRKKFTFACTASGVASKCARNWGYKAWVSQPIQLRDASGTLQRAQPIPFAPFYDACLIAARADYCQDDNSYTKNGTLVDLFDSLDGGFTAINQTVGLPYAPNASGTMLHEEYQVSALDLSTLPTPASPHFVFSASDLMTLPLDEQPLMSTLRRSGMESSRYADLDPGRSCLASPYIDRCDPKEPYACYRATNLAIHTYGAFLAVNSPRHCSHDEVTPGEPLDPLCNECVNRICQVDPKCCADPGVGFYPGSLVWDQHCIDLRGQVCRTTPGTDPSGLWNPGTVAPPPSGGAHTFLSGAVGSFEGIIDDGTHLYAEGWSCDPDFPSSSNPIQISIGGALGDTGATLYTTMADRPLGAGWRDSVKAACGGAGRHGFRYQLPDGSNGSDVYVYGIDMNIPGAPFSLLRGGKKTAPGGPTATPVPRGAIWTGWVEPSTTANYMFRADPGPNDKYRVWVNGFFVGGDWNDADPTKPGAFTMPMPVSSLYLLAGTSYAARVEYLRPDTLDTDSSAFALEWSQDGGASWSDLSGQLHPAAQLSGNGLLGTYSPCNVQSGCTTIAAVDNNWSDAVPLPFGLTVDHPFSAHYDGQIVPPISGDYTFTADTDGTVTITVNGQAAFHVDQPQDLNSDICSHDICQTGAAVSRTCNQHNFCAFNICKTDPNCCAITWDARCVEAVASVCGQSCLPSPPQVLTLSAGTKYQVTIDYAHSIDPTKPIPRGAKVRLMWSLPGVPRDVVPLERLFATRTATTGVGINAAYFQDEPGPDFKFANEYLDRVVDVPAFQLTSLPGPKRDASIVCGIAGVPACASDDALGPPALVSPPSGATVPVSGPTGSGTAVTGHAARGAAVNLWACHTLADHTEVCDTPLGSQTTATSTCDHTAAATDCGNFTITVASLPLGTLRFAATQTVGGTPSALSDIVQLQIVPDVDSSAPTTAPVVNQPPNGLVSSSPSISVGGTANPISGSTVVVTVNGAQTSFAVDSTTGAWGGPLSLPPGNYDLAFAQSVNGHTGPASGTINVKVSLPGFTLDSPAGDATILPPQPPTQPSVTVSGHADPTMGDVIVAEGNGQFFVDRTTLPVDGTTGAFSLTLPLDYGVHRMKILQRRNGLDGPAALRTLTVQPPPIAPGIGSLAPNQPIRTTVFNLTGGVGLTNSPLPGRLFVYAQRQGQPRVKIADGPLLSNGTFAIPVTVTGAGACSLSVTQVASSLSGGGTAESDFSAAVPVIVTPGAPTITGPATGTQQAWTGNPSVDLVVAVSVSAEPNTSVRLAVDGVLEPEPGHPVDASGHYAVNLRLSPGTHGLTARAEILGIQSDDSAPPILVTVGDVDPPTVRAPNPAIICDGSQPECLATPDDNGAAVSFAARVTVDDNGTTRPLCSPGVTSGCVPLCGPTVTSSCFSCAPESGSHFPLGATQVTCTAVDDATPPNQGSTSFTVLVKSTSGPVVSGSGLVAEAEGPAGAVVDYQVSADGFITDCSDPTTGEVRACSAWQPANTGLGFSASAVTVDPGTGWVYAAIYDAAQRAPDRAFVSTDHGQSWSELPSSPGTGFGANGRFLIAGSGGIYLPGALGIRVSRDAGMTWQTALGNYGFGGLVADPLDVLHQVAWISIIGGPRVDSVFETHDGWATYDAIGDGLPSTRILAAGIDHFTGRVYVSMYPDGHSAPDATIIYRRVAGTFRLADLPQFAAYSATVIGVAPTREPCAPGQTACTPCDGNDPAGPQCQTFATVVAGTAVSRDGGDSWQTPGNIASAFITSPVQSISALIFDSGYATNHRIYAESLGRIIRTDGARSPIDGTLIWTSLLSNSTDIGTISLAQDATQPSTLYSASFATGFYKSINGGTAWSLMSDLNESLAGETIRDVVVDPMNPQVAYLLSQNAGVFRTTDGGAHWALASAGMDPLAFQTSGRLAIDRFNRNNVYAGGEGWVWKTPNGFDPLGPSWTQLARFGAFALDPVSADTMASVTAQKTGPAFSIPTFVTIEYRGTVTTTANVPEAPWAAGPGFQPSIGVAPFNLQIAPDAARTMLISYDSMAPDSPGLALLSLRDALLPSGATLARPSDAGVGIANVVLDSSDGTDRLFVDGGRIGQTSGVLYRASLTDVRARGPGATWTALGAAGGSKFYRLVIDPTGGGQTMYTLGADSGLYESHDGGQTWVRDSRAPQFLSNLWLSPSDGALYATAPTSAVADSEASAYFHNLATSFPGTLWKRTTGTDTPPGARVLRGDLRVTCINPSDSAGVRSVGPGSTFPIGSTQLQCTATDVFQNVGSAPITITVKDTTPPTITVPGGGISVTAAGSTTVDFAAHGLTVHDTIDPNPTLTCTPASGSSFSGLTPVTCQASDHANPPNTASVQFFVMVQPPSGTPPVLTAPDEQFVEATGPTGANVSLHVAATSATGGGLTPLCTPSDGSLFALGTTYVKCTATDASLTSAITFRVTVRDTTPPQITVPSPFTATNTTASGVTVTYGVGDPDPTHRVTVTDAVSCPANDTSRTCAVTCTPESGKTFPIGKTTVICRSIDAAGNQGFNHFDVIVQDLGPPVLTLGDKTIPAANGIGERVVFPNPLILGDTPRAVDPEEGPLGPQNIDCSPPSGTLFLLGDTTVTCVAHDDANPPNETRGSFVVRVIDQDPPTVSVQAPGVLEATGPDGAAATFTASASDAVDGVLTPVCQRSNGLGASTLVASGTVFPIGDTEVVCSATDHAGHIATAKFDVVVRDTRRPTLVLPACNAPAPGCIHVDPGQTGTAIVNFAVTATDEVSCPAGSATLACPVSCTPRAGSAFLPGTTTVTCVARDGAGNESTGSFDVTVSNPACTNNSECASGFCVDGVCCSSACGGGATGDCQACSIAAGGTINGVCTPVVAGKTCRASSGLCDVPEVCNGTSTACPADVKIAAGTQCRASAGVCDPAETCDGTSPACPTDAKLPAGTQCRASTGACDPAEACDGSSPACPSDAKLPAGIICRASGGACDPAEVCDGSSGACPADAKLPAGTQCRASAGACDPAEACDGSSPTCPADAKLPKGTTCRPSAGVCDVAETCDGSSAACPADTFVPAGTVCGPAGTCPGVCSGTSATCPARTSNCCTDTTPPVWSNVPANIVAYATSAGGACVTFTKPKATDAKDGNRPVTCTYASGATFPLNKTTVTCTASDNCGNGTSVSFTVWVKVQAPTDGTFFLKPIVSNGSSIFHIGRPVPVRFDLIGASAGITNLVARFSFTKISNTIQGTVDDTSDETVDDADNLFKYKSGAGIYQYRWRTKDQTQGTFLLKADLGDGITHQINVSLRPAQ
jgi:hypothetical protein